MDEVKATGIVRKVDELGRVVIPKELRRTLHIANYDPMEIWLDGNDIILKPYIPGCIFCGEKKGVLKFKDRNFCQECLDDMIESAMEFYK